MGHCRVATLLEIGPSKVTAVATGMVCHRVGHPTSWLGACQPIHKAASRWRSVPTAGSLLPRVQAPYCAWRRGCGLLCVVVLCGCVRDAPFVQRRHPIRVYHADTGELWILLEGHISLVYELCWAPDSSSLLSASADGSVRCWAVPAVAPAPHITRRATTSVVMNYSPPTYVYANACLRLRLCLWLRVFPYVCCDLTTRVVVPATCCQLHGPVLPWILDCVRVGCVRLPHSAVGDEPQHARRSEEVLQGADVPAFRSFRLP